MELLEAAVGPLSVYIGSGEQFSHVSRSSVNVSFSTALVSSSRL